MLKQRQGCEVHVHWSCKCEKERRSRTMHAVEAFILHFYFTAVIRLALQEHEGCCLCKKLFPTHESYELHLSISKGPKTLRRPSFEFILARRFALRWLQLRRDNCL
eukprot:2002668-Amphidinium_carterae.1